MTKAAARLNGWEAVNRVRRHAMMRVDQAWSLTARRLSASPSIIPFDGKPRFALITVAFATTRYLKLMLLTLSEQRRLDRVQHIVIVDNCARASREGFLRALAERINQVHLVENRWFAYHARGVRAGIRALDDIERARSEKWRPNVLLFCDPDVVFRDPATLDTLASIIVDHDAALVGEFRGNQASPDIQASFLAVRRDIYARRDIAPWVHHGSPALWMQRSIARAGLQVVDFRSNFGGYVLHRGRTAVAAVRDVTRLHPYATVSYRHPHYMGVPHGAEIWAQIEQRHAPLLDPACEPELLALLGEQLARLGTSEG